MQPPSTGPPPNKMIWKVCSYQYWRSADVLKLRLDLAFKLAWFRKWLSNQVCKANTWSWFNGLLDVEEKLLFTWGFFLVDFQWVLPTYDVYHLPGIVGGAFMCMASWLRGNVTSSVTVWLSYLTENLSMLTFVQLQG